MHTFILFIAALTVLGIGIRMAVITFADLPKKTTLTPASLFLGICLRLIVLAWIYALLT